VRGKRALKRMHMDTRRLIIGIVLVISIIAAGFAVFGAKHVPGTESGRLQVSASFYPLYYFASQIGGDKADVSNMTPAGAEPHDYEPAPTDIARIESGGLLILNGAHLESWGDGVREEVDPSRTSVVIAGEGLQTHAIVEEGEEVIDPHFWLSPPLAKQMVARIEAGFEKADPANAPYYAANATSLSAKLDALDAEYRSGLASCARTDIITSHAAFGYLASTYGLNQVPIAGLSPDAEPSPSDLADIVDYAKRHGVKYVFFEALVSPKLAETIAAEIGARNLPFNPIEGLTKDDLAAGKDYFTEMRLNLTNLRIALECAD
jgi:zinc transport system substrate-binding protein